MRGVKLIDRFKSSQVQPFNPSDASTTTSKDGDGAARGKFNNLKSFASKNKPTIWVSATEPLLPFGLPTANTLEPAIDPYLRPINLIETLADLYRRYEASEESGKSLICLEQFSSLCGLGDSKLLRRCLRMARKYASDVHSKVVLSAWLSYEKRDHEISKGSSVSCNGHTLECPKAALVYGYDYDSFSENCHCRDHPQVVNTSMPVENGSVCEEEDESDVSFFIDHRDVKCVRRRIAALSRPLKAMLFGDFKESKWDGIDFSKSGVSLEGMRAVEVYSRTQNVDSFCPDIVLELLSFANRFCCEELKSSCDIHLASLVSNIEDAMILIEYGLEEMANLLVASCLQVLLRELPNCLYNWKVMKIFCSFEARERLSTVLHGSFLLYYFLSQVAMEENMQSNLTVMLLERLIECSTERWQKALSLHQLGCVLLERKEFQDCQCRFEAAADFGHVYSIAGIARARYKLGQQYTAYKLMSSLISEHNPAGWMYQERSLYGIGKEKISDLNTATELDPTLSFPYRYRAVLKVEEKQIQAAISEMDRIIGFKLLPECLELRAWFFIAIKDYESALRDIRAVLTLEPNYLMFNKKMSGDYLIELLANQVHKWSQADCWMHLHDRWSSVDDIGSLAVIQQMLVNDPGESVLRFRQSLLLLRLNCQKAALRCLRLARSHSTSEHERLVYEGWILYDTGYFKEALSRAEKSISIKRSFEAFFLKAYILADTNLDLKSSPFVIQQLEEALKCPSDGLRKGQALNNLGSIYIDCGKLDLARDCYMNALHIQHTRAHQGLARVYLLQNQRKAAYDEMTKLIERAQNNASAYEKRSEYCDRDMASNDLDTATKLDPLRTYPYRYRAAVLMDEQKESDAIYELTKALAFKPDVQMLNLRAAFYESIGDVASALQDCEAALSLDPHHCGTVDLYNRVQNWATNQPIG